MQRKKVEGLSAADLEALPKSSVDNNGFVLFPAPRESEDIKLSMPQPKTDLLGLGYDILVENPEMADFLSYKNRKGGERPGTDGHARNVYRVDDLFRSGGSGGPNGDKLTSGFAYEEDADDVYSNEPDLRTYGQQEVTEEDIEQKELSKARSSGVDEWLSGTTEGQVRVTKRSYDGRNPLPGNFIFRSIKRRLIYFIEQDFM